jgi:putative transcriptional regulator
MKFVETPIFTEDVTNLLSGEEYRGLQLALLLRPGSRGTAMKTKNFDKLVKSVQQAGRIRRGEARASREFDFLPADVKAIREGLGKSQSEFALMIGVSVSTLQNWEQGRRRPEGPARALLKIAAENPEAVAKALR